jgi:hypothetical protein
VGTLGQPSAAWAGDRGDPDPELRALLAAAGDHEGYLKAVAAACSARFLLPVVAQGDEPGVDPREPGEPSPRTGGTVPDPDEPGEPSPRTGRTVPEPDRHAELSAVMLQAPDGRTALPAFSGLDALLAWRPDARPVPCRLDELAVSALQQGAVALLVDIAGPAPLVVEGDLLAELARGHRLVQLPDGGWGWLYADSSES